jgi:hypothetical protein
VTAADVTAAVAVAGLVLGAVAWLWRTAAGVARTEARVGELGRSIERIEASVDQIMRRMGWAPMSWHARSEEHQRRRP